MMRPKAGNDAATWSVRILPSGEIEWRNLNLPVARAVCRRYNANCEKYGIFSIAQTIDETRLACYGTASDDEPPEGGGARDDA